jgi:hypothetical protein
MFGHLPGVLFILVANMSNKLCELLALISLLRSIFIKLLELLEVDEQGLETIFGQAKLWLLSFLQPI